MTSWEMYFYFFLLIQLFIYRTKHKIALIAITFYEPATSHSNVCGNLKALRLPFAAASGQLHTSETQQALKCRAVKLRIP